MMESLPELERLFQQNIADPGRRLKAVRENLESLNMVHTFDASSQGLPGWLAAIDGGTAVEKLATGDLLMSVSAIDGGTHRQPSFTAREDFDALWFTIKPHTSTNDKLLSAARAVQELRIFAQTNPSLTDSEGVRLVDGAWIGNLSTVLFALIDPVFAKEVIEMNDYDSDGWLAAGLSDTLKVPTIDEPTTALALVKSDSDRVYVSRWADPRAGEFILDSAEDARRYTDRFLTSYVLEPGEFITPRTVLSNAHLISRMSDLDGRLELMLTGARNQVTFAAALREYRASLQAIEDDGSLWCVYFKPSAFTRYGKTLKLEFTHKPDPSLTPDERQEQLLQVTRQAIETVNSDIHTSQILEPMCQFNVDRRAKEVSSAMRTARNYLSSHISEEDFYRNLATGYRS